MRETKRIIKYMQDCDTRATDGEQSTNVTDTDMDYHHYQSRPEIATYTRSNNTYSAQSRTVAGATQQMADDRWAGTSSNSAGGSNNSNNLFNKVYQSGR